MKNCADCKQQYPQTAKFCENCGKKLEQASAKLKKKGDYQIPFDEEGNPLHYPEGKITWRDNYVFPAVLEFSEFRRGRSAAYALFTSKETTDEYDGKGFLIPKKSKTYCVFLRDFQDIIPAMEFGLVDAEFTFVKRGMNYGLRIYRAEEMSVKTVEEAAQFFMNGYDPEALEGLLIGAEEDGITNSEEGSDEEEAIRLILSNSKFWSMVWHDGEDGYYEMEPSEETLKKKIFQAKAILDKHHGITK